MTRALGRCPTCERANQTPGEYYAAYSLIAALLVEWEESRDQMFKNLNVARAAWGRISREVENYVRAASHG